SGAFHRYRAGSRIVAGVPSVESRFSGEGSLGRHADAAFGAASYGARLLPVSGPGPFEPHREDLGSDLRVSAGIHLESSGTRRAAAFVTAACEIGQGCARKCRSNL